MSLDSDFLKPPQDTFPTPSRRDIKKGWERFKFSPFKEILNPYSAIAGYDMHALYTKRELADAIPDIPEASELKLFFDREAKRRYAVLLRKKLPKTTPNFDNLKDSVMVEEEMEDGFSAVSIFDYPGDTWYRQIPFQESEGQLQVEYLRLRNVFIVDKGKDIAVALLSPDEKSMLTNIGLMRRDYFGRDDIAGRYGKALVHNRYALIPDVQKAASDLSSFPAYRELPEGLPDWVTYALYESEVLKRVEEILVRHREIIEAAGGGNILLAKTLERFPIREMAYAAHHGRNDQFGKWMTEAKKQVSYLGVEGEMMVEEMSEGLRRLVSGELL